jgi:hypothetical protein
MTRKTKTPALSTQLKTAQAEIAELKKKLEASENASKYNSKRGDEFLAELNGVHTLLDAMPNPPARKAEIKNSWGSTVESDIPAAVRVSVLLATR